MWPVAAPWEPKSFGACPAAQITMSEDLAPGSWPGRGHKTPPFGFIKLTVPGQRVTKEQQIIFMKLRMHMRPEIAYIGPHLKFMSHNTPMGRKYYIMDKNWEAHEYNYKMMRRAIRTKRLDQIMEMIAKMEKAPKVLRPATNLFTEEPQHESIDLFT
jgi:hypothetical protein